MARKSKKRGARDANTLAFSVTTLHRTFDQLEDRLAKLQKTYKVEALLRDLRNARKMFDCGDSMEFELLER